MATRTSRRLMPLCVQQRPRLLLRLWLYGLAFALAAASAAAAASAQPLDVDRAFAPKVTRIDARHIAIDWRIAANYYLYRHAFDFKLADAVDARLGTPQIPPGQSHQDAYFGDVETYRNHVRIRLPIIGPLPDDAQVALRYQGCADAGLCYPPQHKTLTIPAAGHSKTAADRPLRPLETGRSDDLAARLGQSSLWSTVGLFFLLGIGLAFTPCILPMIPIVAGMLGSRRLSRGRMLSATLAYVLAMAAAYAVFGVIAGYFGANIQAALQRPLVLLPFAGLFALLAAASFGWFEVRMPTWAWAPATGADSSRRSLLGAAGIGFSSALVAGPCLAPPLAGALLFISSGGHVLIGAIALFALGLGIGVPLLALALFGARVLPRSGPWLGEVRVFFGVLLFAVGLWLALRLASPAMGLAAWGALALIYGAYLSTRPTQSPTAATAKRIVVLAVLGYAALAGAGLAIGNGHSTAPLAGLAASSTPPADSAALFQSVDSPSELQHALAAARRAGRPAMVDVYADWCVDCVRMKHTLFAEPKVRRALSQVAAIEFDVTAYDQAQRQFLSEHRVFGPPTLLFYDARGQRQRSARLVGRVDSQTLLSRLEALPPGPRS
ncbi:protein-disulfide reductase DsbD [Salinisphaera sp. SPP-AMP-43]|uniref:protein-disulfide reductase DsbD n=1 Tax=Salinisphaera sp. SPP-AMP-43 TaxID=3121288 RepID=UPI003C6E712C